MTKAGTVFTCLNLLLALVFLLLVAPIAEHRSSTTAKIDETDEKIAPLPEEILAADRDRFKLEQDVNRSKDQVRFAVNLGIQIGNRKSQRTAYLQDLLNSQRTSVRKWRASIQDTQAEIDARVQEIARLEQENSQFGDDQMKLDGEIAQLTAALKQAREGLAATLKDNDELYTRIVELENSSDSAENVATRNRSR